jgi:orotidine-5'-phosphate decarboxylase
MHNPIIVALDVADVERAAGLVEQLSALVGAFKVGSELFTLAGPDIVRRIRATGAPQMLRAAVESGQNTALDLKRTAPLLLGVTVLTSLDSNELSEIGFQANAARQVERLAGLAVKAGLGGLVCSPLEVVGLRQMLPSRIKLVTPGIRTPGQASEDQKRTLSPSEALAAGADWLVIGRPIYAAPNPRAALEAILSSLQEFKQP